MDGTALGLFLSPMALTFSPDNFCFVPHLSCYQQDEFHQEETEQNEYFSKGLEELKIQIRVLSEENTQLKNQVRPKRNYSKRRELPKTFICHHEKCNKEYSSIIALRCHLKKKHTFSSSETY